MRKGIVLLFLVVFVAASSTTPPPRQPQLVRRQTPGGAANPTPSPQPPAASTPPAASPSTPPANTSPANNEPQNSNTNPSNTLPSSPSQPGANSTPDQQQQQSSTPLTPPSSTATPPPSSTDNQSNLPQQSNNTPPPSPDPNAASVTSNAQSSTIVTVPPANNTSDAASSATSSNPPKKSDDSGVSIGTIVGLSVAGGVAAIAIIGFIIWKLTRKRFPDFDEDNTEAIKWPELNNSHAASSTGDLSRAPSNAASDPYAVPPLPQFNPNQPYRDDPHAAPSSAYYDPYRGPVPQTFQDDMGENIPMSTYPASTRTRSPGPAMAYDMGGRGSPAPGRVGIPLAGGYDAGISRGSPAPTPAPGGAPFIPGAQPEMARYHSPGPNMYG